MGCGASIQAIYEGDVRFERCMALDARPNVNADSRQTCWREWVAFYTYGQTRDRVLHAQLRIQQLDGDGQGALDVQPSSDGEPLPLAQLGKSQSLLVEAQRVESCETECDAVHLDCVDACTGPDGGVTCRPGCEAGQRACHEQCRR